MELNCASDLTPRHNDGDDGEEKEGLHDFAECETKTSAHSLGKRDVTEGRWDIHGTQI